MTFKLQHKTVYGNSARPTWRDFKPFRGPSTFPTEQAARDYAATLDQDGVYDPVIWRVVPVTK
jgi:hypothetical protein